MSFPDGFPSHVTQIAIEIVDLPIKNCDFPVRFLYVYQRVDDRQVGSEYGGVDGGNLW